MQEARARKIDVRDDGQAIVRKTGQSASRGEEIQVVIGAAIEGGGGAN